MIYNFEQYRSSYCLSLFCKLPVSKLIDLINLFCLLCCFWRYKYILLLDNIYIYIFVHVYIYIFAYTYTSIYVVEFFGSQLSPGIPKMDLEIREPFAQRCGHDHWKLPPFKSVFLCFPSITKRWNTSRLWKFMFISWHPAGWTPIILEDLVEKHLVGPAGRHHLKGDIQMLRSAATVNVALLTPGGIQHSWLVSLFADALVGRIAVAKKR